MKIAIIGVTGLVGRVMLKVLEESRLFKGIELIPAASERSAGKKLMFHGKEYTVCSIRDALIKNPHIALFSAGTEVSREWVPEFAEKQCYVIDNSSAWRNEEKVPLVIPEVNASSIKKLPRIIANPNCSTIQMVMVLAPLYKKYGIKRVVISTYQSVSGSGAAAVLQLKSERKGIKTEKAYPHPIDLNLFPHGGKFLDNGYTTEEQKLVDEGRKILDDHSLQITATVVRVPVFGGHSEAVNIELNSAFELDELRTLLAQSPGITVQDDIQADIYPMPLFAEGKDDVFVGRIRRDESCENSLNLWIVSDNLRKGAATNAVQIAEYLVKSGRL